MPSLWVYISGQNSIMEISEDCNELWGGGIMKGRLEKHKFSCERKSSGWTEECVLDRQMALD